MSNTSHTNTSSAGGAMEGVFNDLQNSTWYMIILPALGIVLGAVGVFLNYIVVQFLHDKYRNLTINFICFFLAISDLITGIGAVIQGISLIVYNSNRSTDIYSFPVFYILCQVSSRTSSMYNVFLTLTRTYTIVAPLSSKTNRIGICLLLVVLVGVFWMSIGLLEVLSVLKFRKTQKIILLKEFYALPKMGGSLMKTILCPHSNCSGNQTLILHWIYWIAIILPFAIPSIICFISGSIQIRCIKSKGYSIAKKNAKYQERMTVTIFILTLAFFIGNTLNLVVITIVLKSMYTKTIAILCTITNNQVTIINSIITPVVLICRGRLTNQYARQVCRKAKNRVLFSSRRSTEGRSIETFI